MREIKFRAWDSHNKRWVYNLLYRIDGLGELAESYRLMQYTGLNDKNGVAIYEGDIIKCEDRTMDLQVVYNQESCLFEMLPFNGKEYLGLKFRHDFIKDTNLYKK